VQKNLAPKTHIIAKQSAQTQYPDNEVGHDESAQRLFPQLLHRQNRQKTVNLQLGKPKKKTNHSNSNMKVHEYQAKQLFKEYGLPVVDQNILCRTVEEAVEAYRKIGEKYVVVKAQVHTGGRGKAGGVKLASSEEEARKHASAILGMDIKGFTVDRVLVTQAVDIESEYYVSVIVDRKTKSPIFMVSRAGGMDIEQVARETPEKIVKIEVDPLLGATDFKAREVAYALFDDKNIVKQAVPVFQNLYRLFVEKDASLAEINPLVLTKEGTLKAIDAKMTFDNNSLFRHPELMQFSEPTEEEKVEQTAKSKGFSYVNLGGEIGCMVNGAGLAMATMDMIKLYGGSPANFLDIGGSSNPEKIVEAMKLLLADSHVKVVLINIFGGITRCDDVAKGLLEAFDTLKTDIPVVIRLTGTNEAEGREILKGTKFTVATTMGDAGRKAVELAANK
jgi:succinyl-CoA synthetase beta subunit